MLYKANFKKFLCEGLCPCYNITQFSWRANVANYKPWICATYVRYKRDLFSRIVDQSTEINIRVKFIRKFAQNLLT